MTARRASGRLRIIGGRWRSRIVDFDATDGVRPTPDRVRQTLFDWLAPVIEGSRCLDLFAGSGALGLEALSRGAAHVTFVETGTSQVQAIHTAVSALDAGGRAQIIHGDALAFLSDRTAPPFDVVFLDPPFGTGLINQALQRLPPLAPLHRVYLEWPYRATLALPPGWRLLREKRAGQVQYALAVHEDRGADPGTPESSGITREGLDEHNGGL